MVMSCVSVSFVVVVVFLFFFLFFLFFFFNDTATTEIYTLSLHDALPIYFNLERMPKSVTGCVSSIKLKAKLNAGGNYRVHATVLVDREMSFFGSGKKMNINLR